jgi:hypothetical protein
MRPVRIITAFAFAAAVAVTGCTAHSTAVHPAAAPVTTAPPPSPAPKLPIDLPQPTHDTTPRQPVVRPVLADGRYDAYIRTVDTGRDRLVVDLVQVFQDKAAVTAAIQDGKPRDTAQYLSVWVRNQNPRLRTLPLARDLRLDLGSGDCEAPLSQRRPPHEWPHPRLLLHADRAGRRRAPGPGVPDVQRVLSNWPGVRPPRAGRAGRCPALPVFPRIGQGSRVAR